MSEFKSAETKAIQYAKEQWGCYFDKEYPDGIKLSYGKESIKDYKAGYNQALLDSKYSEMLEMLNTYLNDLNNIFPRTDACINRMNQVNELIKSATEG